MTESLAGFRAWAYAPHGKPKSTWEITREEAFELFEQWEEPLAEIEQLVRHEWREKDHSAGIVLNSIEQVLDARKSA